MRRGGSIEADAARAVGRAATAPRGPRPMLTLERSYRARLACVWVLWTTPAGLESWWGPEGFSARIEHLDLRPGGEWRYTISAATPAAAALLRRAHMPPTTRVRANYTEVSRHRRIRYTNLVDFIPGVPSYELAVLIELHATGDEVLLVLSFDAMHDESWTQRARAGWESQLGRLALRLA